MNGLPDIVDYNLKILFIGYNPGLRSAELGHHYAGTSNNFWKLLFDSGLTPHRFKPEDDIKLLKLGYGSINIVGRPTKSASEIKASEYREGSVILKNTLIKFKPRIACYLGIGVYKVFTGKKNVMCGLQQESAVEGVTDYVCGSPSGLNRTPYKEQLQCFKELKRLENLCLPNQTFFG